MGAPCLEVGALESIVRGEAPGACAAEHLRTCSACRARLGEMRQSEAFLDRFVASQGVRSSSRSVDGEPDPEPRLADEIPGYTVERLVGSGGQGFVYRARQLGTGRAVAIKVPHAGALRKLARRFRFEREIELTARLDHPGIVRVLCACELADGRVGCVMEFIEGVPIDEWAAEARAAGAAGVRQVVTAIAAVADAVAYAHQRAVMHRDLKPSNVIVGADGRPRVLDFGLAKAVGQDSGSFATMTGAFAGTLAYSAPEQVSGDRDSTDVRTDVHGLGLLLYSALSGRLPYDESASTMRMLHLIREGPVVPLASTCPAAGAELDAITMRALQIDPARRYQSAAALRDDLRRWLEGAPVQARSDSSWYLIRKMAWRHRVGVAICAASLMAAGLIVALAWSAQHAAARADLAAAVRDARARESHWSTLADARGVAREDNFELGETAAWDALLGADDALVRAGVEGPPATGALPTSPAYWALWEMYQRTPVVSSIPGESAGPAAFCGGDEQLLVVRTGSIERWDWRSTKMNDLLGLPSDTSVSAVRRSPIWGMRVALLLERQIALADIEHHTIERIGEGTYGLARVWKDRLVAVSAAAGQPQALEIWDVSVAPAVRLARHLSDTGCAMVVCTPDGAHLVSLEFTGGLRIFDAQTGAALGIVDPREGEKRIFIYPDARGGSIVVMTNKGTERLTISSDGTLILRPEPTDPAASNVRESITSGNRRRYALWTGRSEISIGTVADASSQATPLATLRGSPPALSGDARYLALALVTSKRMAVLDLEWPGVRSISQPAPVGPNGQATAFKVLFSERSDQIYVGGMDGALRRASVRDATPRVLLAQAAERGVCTLAACGEDLFVGGHDLGGGDAQLVRVRDGAPRAVRPGASVRYSGLVVAPGEALWSLSADGWVRRYDAPDWTLTAERRPMAVPNVWDCRAMVRLAGRGLLLIGRSEPGLLLVDERTLQQVGAEVATPSIRDVAACPTDPNLVASAHDDGTVRLWRLSGDAVPVITPLGIVGTHSGPCFCIAFHPGGRVLASGGGSPEAQDVRIWDISERRPLASMGLFAAGVFDIEFSGDGRWLAACGEVDQVHPELGGQAFLIDMEAPNRCMAGNLPYHLDRRERKGELPNPIAADWRTWLASWTGAE